MTKLNELNEEVELPLRKQIRPYEVELIGGETYHWCSCGLSDNHPFCDGSHVDTVFEPVNMKAQLSSKYYLFGCKGSENKPHCHGNRRRLNAENIRQVTGRGAK